MEKVGKRLDYIDALKGFGIILVVLGHMHFGYEVPYQYIYAFHMPLFFLVSGYLYKRPVRMADGIKKKVKGLLVPYFIFGLGYFCFWLIYNYTPGIDWASTLKAVLWVTVDGLPVESALWFLMVMFWAWLIYALIDRFIRNPWTRVFLIVLISSVGALWGYVMPFRLPWGLQDAFAVQMFFLFGHAYRKWEENGSGVLKSWERLGAGRKICFLIVGILIDGIFIGYNGSVNIRLGTYPGFILTYFNAVLAVWLWAELIKCLMTNRVLANVPGYVFKRIGLYSIVWLCINHPVIRLAKNIGVALLGNVQYLIIRRAFIVVVALAIMYAIAEIVMHTPARVIFGKWKKREKSRAESN